MEKLYIKIVAQTRKSHAKRTGLESHYFGQNLFDLTSCTDVSNKLPYKRARLWLRMQDVSFILVSAFYTSDNLMYSA